MSTSCVFPPELDNQQLLEYFDDPNTHQEIAKHLEKCSYCREKAEALDHFQDRMASRLYRSACPSPTELGEYHLRLLPDPQKLIVAQHVRECPYCARELSGLEGFLSDVSPKASLLEPVKVLVAHLISSGAQMAVRGEVPTAPVFEVDDIVISLEPQQTSEHELLIQGLIAADNQEQWTGAIAELQQDYLTSLVSYVDELGGFSFKKVAPGPSQVTIKSPAGIAVQTEKVNLTR